MTGTSQSVFSSARRAKRPRWTRAVTWILILVVVVAVLIGLLAASLWGYAWFRLGGDAIPALADDVEALGTDEPQAPSEATTVLVTMTGPRDPTSPRGPELAGPAWLVQTGGPREVPAVVLLPPDLPVPVDGAGTVPLAEAQLAGDSSGLFQAVTDYTEVAIDHVVSFEEEALPRLIDHLGPVSVCGDGDDCAEVDGDAARRALADASPTARVTLTTDLLRAVAASATPVDLLRSPLATKRGIDTVADVHTDVALRGMDLLDVARLLEGAPTPVVATLPIVRNPQTDSTVYLEEATTIFQRFAEGAPLDGVSGDDQLEQVIGEVPVLVLNAAGISGLAGRVEARLSAAGFQVVGTDNAPAFDEDATTVIRHLADDAAAEATAIVLAERLPDAELESVDRLPDVQGGPVAVQVLAGADLDEE